MHWSDRGIVLSARRHGETSLVVNLLTLNHGRHAGLAKGGAGKAGRALYQPGNELACEWSARLADHLGNWKVEARRLWTAGLLDDPPRLSALSSACALVDATLPEREPHPALYGATHVLLAALAADDAHWPEVYVRWELGLLTELGFGLDLETCAATGGTDDLTHVSPRSGRAVSSAAALPYGKKLFRLPAFLSGGRGGAPANDPEADIRDGLALTGFFLHRNLFHPHQRKPPAARQRFVERFGKTSTISGI